MTPVPAGTSQTVDLVLINVGDMICALPCAAVQEILRSAELTRVHHAPDYVRGVINLRGAIVTIVDVKKKLGFDFAEKTAASRIVIVRDQDENIGLLVDGVDDIIAAETSRMAPPPLNLHGLSQKYFTNIYKMDRTLAALIDIGAVLAQ